MEPPAGTIALLFTDIEGSTALAARLGARWTPVLVDHHALVGGAIATEGGFVDRTEGDAFFATFADAAAAARAAVRALRALRAHAWPAEVGELRVRMGLHVGHVEHTAVGYAGLEVHRAARVAAAAHGGQLLLTAGARAAIGDAVPSEPVGAYRLKDFPAPEPLYCAVVDGRGAAAFPPPRAHDVRPTNLPAGLPALVGRDDDLRRVRDALLLEGERLVTVTGRGGVGKTSLALAAAAGLLDEHPGGVWLIRLAPVAATREVLPAVAAAVGAEGDGAGSPGAAIATRLRERGPVLLVLDNLEHLTAAAPELARLLDAVPDLRVLATSQVPLRLGAERCLPLDALDDAEALDLIERVVRRRGAALAPDRGALLDLVRLLDGLPLALELAAARLALLSPAQLLERLRASVDLLQDPRPDRPERHRSLRATVDWSLGLLDPAPRALFTRLGAFAGPVELEELEAVAGGDGLDVLEALAALVEVALAHRVETGDGRIRFGLPEALRQIASEQLDAAPDGAAWRRAHARRQRDVAWAARWIGQATGAAYKAAVAADAEAAAALPWAIAHDDATAAPLAAARAGLLTYVGRLGEAFALFDLVLTAPSGNPAVDGYAHAAHGFALFVVERTDEALAAVERALAIAEDPGTRAWGLLIRGLVHSWSEAHDAAVRDCEAATELARSLGPAFLAGALLMEAQTRLFAGEIELAVAMNDEAERLAARVDSPLLWYGAEFPGDVARMTGRPGDALEPYVRGLETAQALGNQDMVLTALVTIAQTLAELGADAAALEVAGLAEAQSGEMPGYEALAMPRVPGPDALPGAAERLGPMASAECRARGRAIPAGLRVLTAGRLARAHVEA